jgi:hypothetical protein
MRQDTKLKAVRLRLRQEAEADSMKAMTKVELKQKEEPPSRDFGAVNDLAEALAEGLKEEYRERKIEKKRAARRKREHAAEPEEATKEEEKVEDKDEVKGQEAALLLIEEQDKLTLELREAEARMQKVKERRAAAAGWSGTNDTSLQRVTSATFNNIKAPAVKHSSSSLFKWDSGSLLGGIGPLGVASGAKARPTGGDSACEKENVEVAVPGPGLEYLGDIA